MPFDADIRAGYVKIEFNMSWFYLMMEEDDWEISFTPSENDYHVKAFERYIEDCVNKFVAHFTFSRKAYEDEFNDVEENIWFYLNDMAHNYAGKHPEQMTIEKREDE